MKPLRFVTWLVLAALVAWASVRAEETRVKASVDPQRVEEGDSVTLTIQITGTGDAPDEPPDLSQIPGFALVSGPSTSTVYQWINGRSSGSRSYTYTLLPQGTGTRTISPIAVKIGGTVYRTDPLRVDVVPRGSAPGGGQGGQGGQGGNPPPGESPFSDPGVRRRIAPPPTVPGQIFVEASVDHPEVYPGEQTTLFYRVYTQFEILQMSLKDQPTYQGFWVEDLKTGDKYEARTVTRKEGTFIEYTVLKKALFPTNPGSFTIPPATFHFAIRRRGADSLDTFFFQPSESVFRSSNGVSIRVKDLPEQGRPPEFAGAVGRFTLRAVTDRKESRVNDAVGLKIVVEGQGNFDTLGNPVLPQLHDFKRYDPKVDESKEAKGGTLVGSKTWNYVLIPLAPGEQEIPPVRFAFFDPATARYQVLSTEPIHLSVAKGDLSEMAPMAAVNRSDIPVLGSDIRYIKLGGSRIVDEGGVPFAGRSFLALLLAPLILNASLLVITRRRAALNGSEGLLRRRRAGKTARRRLRKARAHLARDHSREFYQEMASTLTAFLADKAGVPASGLTYDRIEAILEGGGAEPEIRHRFRRCLETCDFARFAPASSEKGEMERALREAEEVIASLEDRVRLP